MTFAEMIEKMSPEIYLALKRGIELGKWPNGQALTAEQREISMEAILRYEVVNQVPETERVGYITPKPKKNQPAQDDVSSIKILH